MNVRGQVSEARTNLRFPLTQSTLERYPTRTSQVESNKALIIMTIVH